MDGNSHSRHLNDEGGRKWRKMPPNLLSSCLQIFGRCLPLAKLSDNPEGKGALVMQSVGQPPPERGAEQRKTQGGRRSISSSVRQGSFVCKASSTAKLV